MFSKTKVPLIISIGSVLVYFTILIFQVYSPPSFAKSYNKNPVGCEKLGKQAKELCVERINTMEEV
ncbi:hypothetical protein PsalN5692_03755 (plasmid) [Piscirickettsia salmonis]|uniref:hypothetical protein n=1 Tax=Piscirickettsia salmonis TaxID=1238 RepID=UPI0012B86EF2|nr:hypothetical protein [Piscirickettsia salmonis]QGP52247.1 hypothetical protein PsalN5692_03755 [Piscirickettsia salmonis]QGP53721.1 hypothetical protein PsalSR1_01139 [Piscirickettsia salmonis]QGP60367.1 hypothetical protein PsalBI1_02978 [Piscirickettsia salmonis]QGP63295.1 hypothetical protein PsalMR5_01145 [Piscirickettsia salmonis]